jgi:HEAT repeat protein
MVDSQSRDWDVVAALDEVFRRGQDADARAARLLVDSSDPIVEQKLQDKLGESGTRFGVEAAVSRILVERNPDRDPSFLRGHLIGVSQATRPFVRKATLKDMDALSDPFLGAHVLGFSRLRKLDPVAVYARQLDNRLVSVRSGAAVGLGDTADLAALEPLARALADPHWKVRMNAADSVRRLRHTGAGTVLATHPVRERLVECLTDRHRPVRVAAAQALGSVGDVEPLRQCLSRCPWWAWRRRRDLAQVLRGDIPPLRKTWPGDDTT